MPTDTPQPDEGARYAIGDLVLVAREPGPPVEAEIAANNPHRPHLVKVIYLRSRKAPWIARTRILGPAPDPATDQATDQP
jgi:hypothetical protein